MQKQKLELINFLRTIVQKVPPPTGDPNAPLQALIFDSVFDSYRGAIAYIRVFQGTLRTNDKMKFFKIHKESEAEEIGILGLKRIKSDELSAGDVGYLIAGVKDVHDTKVGDTVTHVKNRRD